MFHARWAVAIGIRLYGVLNYDMAISDTPDVTLVLKRGCGVCVGKRTSSDTRIERLG